MKKEFSCDGCKAKCCRYIAIEIDEPRCEDDYENILWYLVHKNMSIFIDEKKWYVQFNTKCKELDENWRCKIYSKRPEICRSLKNDSCEQNGEGDPYDVMFTTPEEFRDYMKKKGVKIRELR